MPDRTPRPTVSAFAVARVMPGNPTMGRLFKMPGAAKISPSAETGLVPSYFSGVGRNFGMSLYRRCSAASVSGTWAIPMVRKRIESELSVSHGFSLPSSRTAMISPTCKSSEGGKTGLIPSAMIACRQSHATFCELRLSLVSRTLATAARIRIPAPIPAPTTRLPRVTAWVFTQSHVRLPTRRICLTSRSLASISRLTVSRARSHLISSF